jgi:hypothetical protein
LSLPVWQEETKFRLMLLTVQFPIIDSRCFLDDTGKLETPNWTYPVPEFDFIRGFGIIRNRKLRGIEGWIGENEICEANRVIRFKGDISLYIKNSKKRTHIYCAFRRLYFDGMATGKYELGFGARLSGDDKRKTINSRDLISLVLSLPADILVDKKRTEYELIHAGRAISRSYLRATTEHGTNYVQNWWVSPCPPVLFLEYQAEKVDFPFPLTPILQEEHHQLSWCLFPHQGKNYHLWILKIDPHYVSSDYRYDKARSLRIALLRLNAEHESIRTILRNIESKKITDLGDALQSYLNSSTSKILKLERSIEHESNSDAIRLSRLAYDKITPGEKNKILQSVENIRLNIRRKIDEYSEKDIKVEINMGDVYKVGQAGAVGPNSHAEKINFNNLFESNQSQIDLQKLADELIKIQKRLDKMAEDPTQKEDKKNITKASEEAKKGNGSKALEYLSKVGMGVLDVAVKIGAPIATTAIKAALGIP